LFRHGSNLDERVVAYSLQTMAPKVESTLPNLLAFCRAFEHGSFTLAARALSVTPAAVSRAVARLEGTLGVSLFRRTTRALRPTAEGRAYYEKCAAALALLAEAEEELADATSEEGGLVRLSVPTTYGLHRLLPRLAGFHQQHPGIELELEISNHNTELVREGVDLAIRMGTIRDAGLVARKLGDFSVGVFASPAYLRRRGEPMTPEELDEHHCIAFLIPRTGLPLPWIFAAPTAERAVRGNLRVQGDPMGAVALARAGEGLVQTYHFLIERELAAGQLVEVLGERAGRSRPFSLIYRKERARSRAVRAVIAYILATER
jgi:DNA-binding transcriptional LysR family regulator